MSLSVCILGSGSSGNSTYVGSENTRILIDAGLSGRETIHRLNAIGVPVETLEAVCITHEHQDHTAGIRVLHNRHKIPLYANSGTIGGIRRSPKMQDLQWTVFHTGTPFEVGDLLIEPFSVPHDAYDPVGFVVTHGEVKVGIVMDMGMATTLVRERLRQCQAVIVESNHDEALLHEAQRPWYLKQRIKGRQGHLSNAHAAKMLADIAGPQLHQIFLAHLSEDCNRHELALETAQQSLAAEGHIHIKVSLTFPDRVSEVWSC